MNKEINLDRIDLSIIPNAPPAKHIVNRVDHTLELFNIIDRQTKKLNISLLIPDQSSNEYYGIYLFYCANEGFSYQTVTHNFYATYQAFRQPHEAQGWRFKTKGARINAQVSGMLVGYGGFNAYLIDKQTLTSNRSDIVDIFEYDADISEHDTVITQKAFHEHIWRGTINSARKRGVAEDLLNYVMGK